MGLFNKIFRPTFKMEDYEIFDKKDPVKYWNINARIAQSKYEHILKLIAAISIVSFVVGLIVGKLT